MKFSYPRMRNEECSCWEWLGLTDDRTVFSSTSVCDSWWSNCWPFCHPYPHSPCDSYNPSQFAALWLFLPHYRNYLLPCPFCIVNARNTNVSASVMSGSADGPSSSLFMYRGADKSLAWPGGKQANVSVTMVRISFYALPCRKKTWWQLASRCCWNRARPWRASELVSFLVGQRTYQHPVIMIVAVSLHHQLSDNFCKIQKENAKWTWAIFYV